MKLLAQHLFWLMTSALILACGQQPFARESGEAHLIYTTNLNGSLDDCQCGDDPVGGFTRVLPELERLASQYPNRLIVDAGDFLNSYSLPEANRLMLKLLALAPYDAITPGDQEFVEAAGFIRQVSREEGLSLPLLASNLADDSAMLAGEKFKRFSAGPFAIFVIGIVNKKTFDFIAAPAGGVADDAAVLEGLAEAATAESDLQVLLYHGERSDAERLAAQFPWLDVIVLAHQQQKAFSQVQGTVLVESGSNGEYIGHLRIRRTAESWQFANEFIPISRNLPLHPEAKRLVLAYYQQIGAGTAPENELEQQNSGEDP